MLKKNPSNRPFKGTVIQAPGIKTCVVTVKRRVMHKRYRKVLTKTKRFIVEDLHPAAKVGDYVEFVPCKPISKRKRWKIIKVFGKNKR